MAFALEPQKYPDSPHHAHFPSTIVQAGTLYTHECVYKFSTV
jgi:aldose 1-epimerase